MKRFFQTLISLAVGLSSSAYSLDLKDVKTQFYAEVLVSEPDGNKAMPMSLRYDGEGNTALVGPPPPGAPGKLRLVGNHFTNKFVFWVENDPKRTAMTMDQQQFAQAMGVDLSKVKQSGKKLGTETYLGEDCEHWQLNAEVQVNGKPVHGYLETCVSADNIELWGSLNGKLVHKITRLEREPQPKDMFELPPGYKLLDISTLMQQLQKLKPQ